MPARRTYSKLLLNQGFGGELVVLPRIVLSALSVSEAGGLVGTLSVVNGAGSYTFTVSEDPDEKFSIESGNELHATGLNFEEALSHLVEITASDGDVPVNPKTFSIGVTNVVEAPVFASAPVVTGDLDGMLMCSTGTLELPDGAGATFAYQWKDAADDSDLAGETGNTLNSQDHIGLSVYCEVTATNSADSTAESSNTVGPLLGVATENLAVGHSLTGDMWRQFYAFVTGGGHVCYLQNIPGASLQWNWNDEETPSPDGYNVLARAQLAEGTTDRLVLTEVAGIEDAMVSQSTREYFQTWRTLAVTNKPTVESFFYAVWQNIPDFDTTPDWTAWLAQIEADEVFYRLVSQQITRDISPAGIKVIPGGPALAALYAAISAEEVNGLTDMEDIFLDSIHLSPIGAHYIALVTWAIIHGQSPVGLPWELSAPLYGEISIPGLTEEMAADLQAVAWAFVQAHPMAGIQTWPTWEVPDAFEEEDWTLTAGDEQLAVGIVNHPAGNGAPIEDYEYRIDGGSWISSNGMVSFVIENLTNETEYDIEIRAVSEAGAAAASDLKAETPVAPPAGIALGEWQQIYYPSYPATPTSYDAEFDLGSAVAGRTLAVLLNNFDKDETLTFALDPDGDNVAPAEVFQTARSFGNSCAIVLFSIPSGMSGTKAVRITGESASSWTLCITGIVMTGADVGEVTDYVSSDGAAIAISTIGAGHAVLGISFKFGDNPDTHWNIGGIGSFGAELWGVPEETTRQGFPSAKVVESAVETASEYPSTVVAVVVDIGPVV